jgi:hypothetical protein
VRFLIGSLTTGALALGIFGCGPLQRPMPVRLDNNSQNQIEEAWNRALSPVTRHDHQALLDMLITTGAYENGVDELSLRSTKRYQGGLVVMELHYNRLMPENDRFVVQVLDNEGKLLRQESYDRAEIEKTNNELSNEVRQLNQKKEAGGATAEELNRLADLEARLEIVEQGFPKFEEN